MVHDVRIIRLGKPSRLGEEMRPWFGDSWGRWDGNTLVVETTNLNLDHWFRGAPRPTSGRSPSVSLGSTKKRSSTSSRSPTPGRTRLGRADPPKLLRGQLYEYACHEENYAWNIRALCRSYLHIMGAGANLEGVSYFSALAKHLEATKPKLTRRHRDFMLCLLDDGVEVKLARFKKKTIRCDHCGQSIIRREEKETDVAIATKLFEFLLHQDRCDTVVIMSGDTDLAPAARTAKVLFPQKTVGFAFPYRRKNKELAQIADLSFQITKEQYARYQFPDPYVTQTGQSVAKPHGW